MTTCLSINASLLGRPAAGIGFRTAGAKALNDGAPPGAPWSG